MPRPMPWPAPGISATLSCRRVISCSSNRRLWYWRPVHPSARRRVALAQWIEQRTRPGCRLDVARWLATGAHRLGLARTQPLHPLLRPALWIAVDPVQLVERSFERRIRRVVGRLEPVARGTGVTGVVAYSDLVDGAAADIQR